MLLDNEKRTSFINSLRKLREEFDELSEDQFVLENSYEIQSNEKINNLISDFNELKHNFQELLGYEASLEHKSGSQSKTFMIDLIPHIENFLRRYPYNSSFSLLDVGPGTGDGSNLLASIYNEVGFLGPKLKVDIIDIDNRYINHIKLNHHFINNCIIGDIFDLELSYDIVICSHVIEHVNNPLDFCKRLLEITQKTLFIIAPLNERKDIMCPEHINIFDDEFLNQLNPTIITKVSSRGWGIFLDPPYEMFIAQFDKTNP